MESIVKNTLIFLNEKRIRTILKMPRSSICVPKRQKKINGLKCILEREDVNEMVNLLANQLLVELRPLHNIVSRIFFL